MSIILVGMNHRTAPVYLREQLALNGDDLQTALKALPTCRKNSRKNPCPLQEGVILSTCNRLEVYAVADDPIVGWRTVQAFISNLYGIAPNVLRDHLYLLSDEVALEHLMRVATGLDSMVLGEHQVLGQVREAYTAAQDAKTVGAVLSTLFKQAVHAGKRARSETPIGRYTTSISHTAALLAKRELGTLDDVKALVVGAGETASLAATALQANGAQDITCINRTYMRASALAEQVNGRALAWFRLLDALTDADVVITVTGAPHTVIHREEVEQVLQARGGRPLLLVDIAVPRDVQETVGDLPGVRLYDIDALQTIVDGNLAQRAAAVDGVEVIVDEEIEAFSNWMQGRMVVPVIVDLRKKAQLIAEAEVEEALRRLGLDEDGEATMRRMAHRLVNKLLHDPTVRLKQHAADGDGYTYAHALRDLFALEEDEEVTPQTIDVESNKSR